MRLIGQKPLIPVLMVAIGGCATNLSTPAGDAVSAGTYNRAIAKQGLAYYCGAGNCDKPPTLISATTPQYPLSALSEGRSGLASVLFEIETTGAVSNLKLESASSSEFGEAALEAISTWKYSPATLKGQPVKIGPVRQQIPFDPSR